MRIDRMLSIIIMMLNRDRISAKELAEKFEVSVRTIYRDIEAINLSGIPVISYPGNTGGFGIMENYRIDRQVLSLKDMLSILSALRNISNTLEFTELDNAIEKIDSLIPKQAASSSDIFEEQFVIDVLPWGYGKKRKKLLQTIQKAIQNHIILEFSYRNTKGETTDRLVEPLTTIFKGYAWYLFAYCRLRENFRLFRLTRIRNLKITDKKFSRKNATYKNYINPTNPEPAKIVHMVLKFSSKIKTRVEDFFGEDHITENPEGYLIVKVSFPEDDWVYSFLLSYGEYLEVLKPPHIREIIKKKLKKLNTIYKPDIHLSQG